MATVLQWNCKSIRHKKFEIISLINSFNPSIFAIAETWLRPGSRFRIPGFSCLRDDHVSGWDGCALLIKQSLNYSLIPLPPHSPDFNMVAVRTLNTTFVSTYIPSPTALLISELDSIISSLPPPLVVVGDFNCHHTMWGSHLCDSSSSALLDLLDNNNLCLLNDGSPTRRTSPLQNPSCVDLSLSSPSLFSHSSWKVLSCSHGSDHLPILISFSQCAPASPSPPPPLLKYRLSRAKWHEFRVFISNQTDLFPPVTLDNFLQLYNNFISILISSANLFIPLKKTVRDTIPSPPWWDPECTDLIRERDEEEEAFLNNPTLENYIKFQKIKARSKKVFSKKKRQGWFLFCESLSPRVPSSVVWKNINKFRGSFSDNFNPPSNVPSIWINDFLDRLAPPFVPPENCFPSSSPPSPSYDRLDDPFSFHELSSVLSNLQDSTPGIDGIPYSFLKQCSDSSKLILLSIFNKIFVTGLVPDSWKHQIIIPIRKPHKDPNDPSSYRPIALSSVLAKIMEHLIKNRLEYIFESRKILSRTQFGFRRGMGTMDSLSIFSSDIRLAFSRSQHLVGVFLDITSAYDNVLLPLLRLKMLQLSIPPRLVNIICNLLMARSISVRVQGSLLPSRTVWKGLPQGSVLSPLLYSFYTADLDSSCSSECNILQYADDIALYYSSDSISECSVRLNCAIQYLNDWLTDHGLSLSVSKTSVVVFTRKRMIPDIGIVLGNNTLEVSDRVKFLGIYFDSRLSGTVHINYIRDKCEKAVNILRSLSGVWWGAHPYTQKLLYNAIIRSLFDYGSFLLEPCNKTALLYWDKVQSKCLRIICGAMKSSPINALQVECLDPPLSLRRQFLCDRYLFKTVQNSSHPLLTPLCHLSNLIPSSRYWSHKKSPCLYKSYQKFINGPSVFQFPGNPLFSIPFEALIFKPSILTHFGIDKDDPGANSLFNKILNEKFPGWLAMFTDASKISQDDPVGSAVWVPRLNIFLSFKCPPRTSIFSGESIAIFEAVSWVESHNFQKTIIFTDSKSCLEDILKFPLRSKNVHPLNLKTRELLYKCHCAGIEVVLAWIPGHSGIVGNEQADSHARWSIRHGSESYSYCFSQDLRSFANSDLKEHWSEDWNRSRLVKGKFYGGLQPSIPSKPWFFVFRSGDKSSTSTVIRLRLGHNCSPHFLAKIRVRDHSLCECGLDEGTIDHIFLNCPRYPVSFYDFLPSSIPRPINMAFILYSLFQDSLLNVLLHYINRYKIKL